MTFIETRGNDGNHPKEVRFSEAITSPMASFGGLYAPKSLPKIDQEFIKRHLQSSYEALAHNFLRDCDIDIDETAIAYALERYRRFDDPTNPVPVNKIEADLFVAELYHGPTRAFKDMALQPFGAILSDLAKKQDKQYLILAATSGDTGPATLHAFKNQSHIKVACLYPYGGTSDVQRLQMVTEDAPNLKVIGVKGNFDDTQNALKSMLSSKTFQEALGRKQISLSAANSVNFGRIIFQIIYHIYAYLELLRGEEITIGEKIYLIVPSGNFGNALGAYYAKKAGLPIEKVLIASNQNNILTEWIKTGVYDLKNRELIKTASPAMDILKSSNIERVLFDLYGAKRTKELMEQLRHESRFVLVKDELGRLQEHFDASYSNDEECESVIAHYAKRGYLMDTHTATCIKAYRQLKKRSLKTVLYSTAEWTKFSRFVAKALGQHFEHDKEALDWVSKQMQIKVPTAIYALFERPIVHDQIVEKEQIEGAILDFLDR